MMRGDGAATAPRFMCARVLAGRLMTAVVSMPVSIVSSGDWACLKALPRVELLRLRPLLWSRPRSPWSSRRRRPGLPVRAEELHASAPDEPRLRTTGRLQHATGGPASCSDPSALRSYGTRSQSPRAACPPVAAPGERSCTGSWRRRGRWRTRCDGRTRLWPDVLESQAPPPVHLDDDLAARQVAEVSDGTPCSRSPTPARAALPQGWQRRCAARRARRGHGCRPAHLGAPRERDEGWASGSGRSRTCRGRLPGLARLARRPRG